MINRYHQGGHYGAHVDNAVRIVPGQPVRIRTDLSATLFFSEPDEYQGGELCIRTAAGEQRIKRPAGHMVLYPSTLIHQVTPVTEGQRLCAVFWVQSMVRAHDQRQSLYELDQSIQSLTALHGHDHPDVVRLTRIYHNLLQQWADT